jgi:hypothetical protein
VNYEMAEEELIEMAEEELPEIPRELERYVDKPYGGLFGNSVQVKVVEEIVADPYSNYRPKDLENILEASPPSIRTALFNLTALGLLVKDTSDTQHPIYHVNMDSKKLIALTFLAYATMDDREGSDLMNTAIIDYYLKFLRSKLEVAAVATAVKLQYQGVSVTEASYATAEGITRFGIYNAEV